MATILGCSRLAAASASRRNRATSAEVARRTGGEQFSTPRPGEDSIVEPSRRRPCRLRRFPPKARSRRRMTRILPPTGGAAGRSLHRVAIVAVSAAIFGCSQRRTRPVQRFTRRPRRFRPAGWARKLPASSARPGALPAAGEAPHRPHRLVEESLRRSSGDFRGQCAKPSPQLQHVGSPLGSLWVQSIKRKTP